MRDSSIELRNPSAWVSFEEDHGLEGYKIQGILGWGTGNLGKQRRAARPVRDIVMQSLAKLAEAIVSGVPTSGGP